MKKNLLKIVFIGLLATIFTSCGSSGGGTAVVDDNSTAEAQAVADKEAADKAAADKAAADKAAADKAAADAEEAQTTSNWDILPF